MDLDLACAATPSLSSSLRVGWRRARSGSSWLNSPLLLQKMPPRLSSGSSGRELRKRTIDGDGEADSRPSPGPDTVEGVLNYQLLVVQGTQ